MDTATLVVVIYTVVNGLLTNPVRTETPMRDLDECKAWNKVVVQRLVKEKKQFITACKLKGEEA